MSSVRDIARHSGFSVAAVSKTLNSVEGTIRIGDAARTRILAAARQLRYRPNNDIALLVTPDYSYLDPLTARVLQGVQLEAQNRRSHVLCGLIMGDDAPQLVKQSCVGGVLFLHHAPAHITGILTERGLPYVVLNPTIDAPHDCVICDDGKGMTDAMAHLHSQQCRRFAFIWEENEHPSYAKRLRAFVNFATRRKLEHHIIPRVAADVVAPRLRELLGKPGPVGLIIYEELFPFVLAMTGTKDLHRVRIVTINDLISGRFIPPVSSVRVPFLEMGRKGVELLAQKWDDGVQQLPSVIVRPELMRRELEILA